MPLRQLYGSTASMNAASDARHVDAVLTRRRHLGLEVHALLAKCSRRKAWSRLRNATMTTLRIEAHEARPTPCPSVWASEVASTRAAPGAAVPDGVLAHGIPWHEAVAQTEASAELLRSTGFAASNDAPSRRIQCTSGFEPEPKRPVPRRPDGGRPGIRGSAGRSECGTVRDFNGATGGPGDGTG